QQHFATNDGCSRGIASALRRWRKMLEHVLDCVFEFLLVLFGLIGERLLSAGAPDQLFRLAIKDIYNQCAHRGVDHFGRCRIAETMPPPAAETVVERL